MSYLVPPVEFVDDDPTEVVLEFDSLWAQPKYQPGIRALVKAYVRETEERKAHNARYKEALKTIDHAIQAIEQEVAAMKQVGAEPRLTDRSRKPDDGWEWWGIHGDPVLEGWAPPEALEAANRLDLYIGCPLFGQIFPPPTAAVMCVALAAVHDKYLQGIPPILARWNLCWVNVWVRDPAKRYVGPRGALRSYLNHVRAWLDSRTGQGGNAGQSEGRANKAAAADGGEIITAAVAVQDFHVSQRTLREYVKDGRLKDYRPRAKRGTTSPLKLSRAQLSQYFTQRKN